MGKEYKQLKEIKLQDILDLGDSFLSSSCVKELIRGGFIEEKEQEQWERITLRDLHRIRPGVTLERISQRTEIIHVVSDPYWTSWSPIHSPHILAFKRKLDDGVIMQSGINDLFNGEVYIRL